DECRKAGARVVPALADIGDAAAVESMVGRGLAELGAIDVLVCNAAIRPHTSITETSLEDWHRVMAVDLHSAFYLARAVVPGMKERRRGSIIALGGQSAITGRPNTSAVTAAKSGLLGLIRALAAVLLLPTTSWAALNAYLKLDDCNGTLAAGGLTGLLPLTGFTSKFSTSVATGGGGAGTGKVEAAPIQVLKDFDQCSPQIFLDVVTGRHVKEVTILFTRTTKAGKEQPFYKITLSDATISSVEGTTTARNGTEDVRNIQESAATEVNTGDPTALQEIVAFRFRQI